MTPEELTQGYADFGRYINARLLERPQRSGEPFEVCRVVDGRLVDTGGRALDDFISGWGTQPFGHRNPAVGAALQAFLQSEEPALLPNGLSPHAGVLARRLAERTGYDNAFFASGGTEAVEAALKLARAATRRPRILYLEGGYHGCTFGSNAMMARGPFRDPFAPHLPAVDGLPFGDVAALERALSSPDVAAVVVEPIQAEGGIHPLPAEYVDALCALTAKSGALLVADEIAVGLGRAGRFLATERWPRRPDVVTLGKALGGGYVPISCALTRREIFERAYGGGDLSEPHTSTWSGNALACTAALATLDLLSDQVLDRVRRAGDQFGAALREAVGTSPLVKEVRGEGLLWGVETTNRERPALSFERMGRAELAHRGSAVGGLACAFLASSGYFVMFCSHDWNVIRIQPPLDVGEERLLDFARKLGEALGSLASLEW